MKRNKIIIIIMFFIGLAGICLMSYNYVLSKIRLTFETVNLQLYGNEIPEKIDKNSDKEKEIIDNNKEENVEKNDNNNSFDNIYFGYLEIPKINLKQGLVPLDSKLNTVSKNIQTIYPSDYPDKENGNLILAAHSGTSSIAYFKNLYKLELNDEANIIYNGEKYIYNIVDIYTVPKNGEVAIYRNENINTLTLITCTKNDDTTQTIYIAQLIRKEGV